MFKLMLIAGAGGFFGTCLRYLSGKFFHWAAPAASFPWSTLTVNVVGSLLIGIFYGMAEKHNLLSPAMNVFLITGFCGGLTTFSSFADDMFLQLQGREFLHFTLYLIGSLALGLLMVYLGRSLVRG